MNIRIDKKLGIISDKENFIIIEYFTYQKGKNEGKESYKEISYFYNLDQCINSLLQQKIRYSNAKSFEDIKKIIKDFEKFIEIEMNLSKELREKLDKVRSFK